MHCGGVIFAAQAVRSPVAITSSPVRAAARHIPTRSDNVSTDSQRPPASPESPSTTYGTPTRRLHSEPASTPKSSVNGSDTPTSRSSCRHTHMFCATTTATPRNKRPHSSSAAPWIHARTPPKKAERVISKSNVANHVANDHRNGPRSDLRGPFLLVAGTVSGSRTYA
jgi:hypothetical protein